MFAARRGQTTIAPRVPAVIRRSIAASALLVAVAVAFVPGGASVQSGPDVRLVVAVRADGQIAGGSGAPSEAPPADVPPPATVEPRTVVTTAPATVAPTVPEPTTVPTAVPTTISGRSAAPGATTAPGATVPARDGEPLSSSHRAGTVLGIVLLVAAAALLAVGGVTLWRRLGTRVASTGAQIDAVVAERRREEEAAAREAEFWERPLDDGAGVVIPDAVVDSAVEPEVEAEIEAEVEAEIDFTPAAEPAVEAEPEPVIEPEPAFEPEPVIEVEPEPAAEIEPVAVPFVPPATVEAEPASGGARRVLEQRRDRLAAEVRTAFAEVHRLRIEALRRARGAEAAAARAAAARTRAGRIVQRDRDRGRSGAAELRLSGTSGARTSRGEDAWGAMDALHRVRTDALRQAREADALAGQVERARARAARLLAEQRAVEEQLRARGAPRRR